MQAEKMRKTSITGRCEKSILGQFHFSKEPCGDFSWNFMS